MKVSVVVPCFNHERYVERCLRSIDAQDHGDLDVIIVDDGSTDGTWNALTSFKWRRGGRRVRLFRTKNRGAHAALNMGLELSEGEFIAPCNSDDFFSERRISTLLRGAQAQKARFLFSQVRFVDDDERDITQSFAFAKDLFQKQNAITRFPSVGYSLVLTNTAISTGNFFFHRSLVREVGFFRPYRYCHDWDYALRALLVTEPAYVAEPLYAYRLHPTNSFKGLQKAAEVECPELMRRFLKAAVQDRPLNKLAPSPSRWPVFFETFIADHHYEPYMVAWEQIDAPYYAPERGEDESTVLDQRDSAVDAATGVG